MHFKELVSERYSVRAYIDKAIEQDKIDYILECVQLAPSAVNFQPIVLYVVTNAELLKQLQGCYKREWFQTASMCFVACGNHQQGWHRKLDGKDHTDIDVAIAVDHLILAATDMGLGSCWICNFDAKQCAAILDLPDNIEPIAMVPVGYTNTVDIPDRKRKELVEMVIYKS